MSPKREALTLIPSDDIYGAITCYRLWFSNLI